MLQRLVLLLLGVSLWASHAAAFAVHQGCDVSGNNGVRAFSFKAAAGDSMTVEACRKLAISRFVTAFSLEAGRECWLDPLNSTLTQLTRFGAGSACTTPCAGDARIVCGGQQQANVYVENDAAPLVIPPNDYAPVGCFKDDEVARRLTLLWVANNSMTVDMCASVAYSEQYLVFGVEAGSECWAGQAIESAKALGASSSCSTPCPGNSALKCGGPLALNLYALQKAPWVQVDSTSEPKALTGTSCVGAAAASDACKGVGSAAAAVTAPGMFVALAAALVGVWLL